MIIGFDAKRIVRNATGLGNYGRTLVNDLAAVVPDDWTLRLYAPDVGHETLRSQVTETECCGLCIPVIGREASAVRCGASALLSRT